MNIVKTIGIAGLLVTLFLSCQPKTTRVHPTPPKRQAAPIEIPELPRYATVTAEKENVRDEPNGQVWGQLHRGQKIEVERRVGNWILFNTDIYDSMFVWGPSVGFPYLNLYSPGVYYSIAYHRFFPLKYFQVIFGSDGQVVNQTDSTFTLFFGNLGLGSHQETVMEVVQSKTEQVKHGVTFWLSKRDSLIERVCVDFFRPVKGRKKALKQCNLPDREPTYQDDGRLRWENGSLFPGLTIELDRKEWKSEQFNRICFYPSPEL